MADPQVDPAGSSMPTAAAALFNRVHGNNVVAGTCVSGGTLNINFQGSKELRDPPSQPFASIPFLPDRDFIERPDIASWLSDKCQPGNRAALIGLGGVGKTQVATQYAHQVRKQFPHTYIFWVHASTRERFEDAYRSIADRLQLPGRHDPGNDVLRLVYDWLLTEDKNPWLMIVDNADDLHLFYPRNRDQSTTAASIHRSLAALLPQSGRGRILVTSRNRDVAERLTGTSWNVWAIPPMDEDQAKRLFRSKLRNQYDETLAHDLVHALEYMPLAITQAAAFIVRRAPRMSPSVYLDEFQRSDKKKASLLNKDMGDLRRDVSATNSVVKTWQMTYEQIQQERRSAAELLSFMSLFNPQGIPEWVLRRFQRRKRSEETGTHGFEGIKDDGDGDGDGDDDDYDDDLQDDIDMLQGYCLVAPTAQPYMYQMHGLVQLCTRIWLSSVKEIDTWKRKFLQVMSDEYSPGGNEHWTRCQQLEPHIMQIIGTEPSEVGDFKNWARLLANAGLYRIRKGWYKAAAVMLRKSFDIQEKIYGGEDLSTLETASYLAEVLRYQDKYEEAEQMNRRVLNGREKALGKDHLITLGSVRNLARVLQSQGQYREAEQMNRQALDGYEKALGKDHLDTIDSVNNLAQALRSQGKYKEGEQMSRRALGDSERVLGKDHFYTITYASHLAKVLEYQNKYEEAEQMTRRALDGYENYEKALGKDHPFVFTVIGNLALLLDRQGKYQEAEQMGRRALDGHEEVLGKDHMYTLTSLSKFASILGSHGKYKEAEHMNRRALDGYERVMGEDHPFTLTSANHLARVLEHQGKYEEAEHLNRRALSGREKVLGKDHQYTITSQSDLARVLAYQGKYEEAEHMNRRALGGREQALGQDYPNKLT